MAFKKIRPHLAAIEAGFKDKKSPAEIARSLGDPGLERTIYRYKSAVWDLGAECSEEWREARAEEHDSIRDAAKQEVFDNLDLINLAKKRGKQLLDLEVGTPYETAAGDDRVLSYASAQIYWQSGEKIICDAIRLELEIQGDDPSSKAANSIMDLISVATAKTDRGRRQSIPNMGSK